MIFAGLRTKPANVTLPVPNVTVKLDFDILFALPEDATSESVYIKITPEGNTATCTDNAGIRALRLASAVETAGEYLITMDRLSKCRIKVDQGGSMWIKLDQFGAIWGNH